MKFSGLISVASSLISSGVNLAKDKDIQSFICGKYADGKVRNVTDALKGEYLSSKQKAKYNKRKKTKKHSKFKL